MANRWVVVLEAARDATHDPIEAGDLEGLHDAVNPGRSGLALHCPDRYALQVTATGPGPIEALSEVLGRWANAIGHLGLPAWELVRIEAFTPEELDRELETAHGEEIASRRPEPDGRPDDQDEIGRELLHRAFSDPLTGLLGLQAFAHRLETALAGNRGRRPVAMVRLDLDGFQRVNHVLGEATGDEVLTALAGRLAATLRPRDLLARLGGDEYGVLLEDGTEEAALAVAQRMLDAVRVPMTISAHDLTLAAGAGVAVSQPGEGAEAVVANAGAALSAAKAAGDGRPVLYGLDVRQPPERRQDVACPALQDRLAHLQLLQGAAVASNEEDTLEEAARVVIRHLCAQVGCVLGHLGAVSAASDELSGTPLWHWADGSSRPALQQAAEALLAGPGGLAARAAATGRPVWEPDLADDEDTVGHELAPAAGLRSAFAFPVLIGREVVAVLAFFSRTRMEPTGSFLDVVAGIGTQLGRVVERRRAAEALRRADEQLRASEALLREVEGIRRTSDRQ